MRAASHRLMRLLNVIFEMLRFEKSKLNAWGLPPGAPSQRRQRGLGAAGRVCRWTIEPPLHWGHISSEPGSPMCRIVFAPSIQRHVALEERELPAPTLKAALEAVFVEAPALRGYLLDDQGGLRRHLTIFIDGLRLRDRARLSDALAADSEVYVVQALSGG